MGASGSVWDQKNWSNMIDKKYALYLLNMSNKNA